VAGPAGVLPGVLPGGYWDGDGRLHREFELAVLTGREEELLAQAGRTARAPLVTEVLSRCVRRLGPISPVPPEVARRLLVADRQYLLLQIRRLTFGDAVHADLVCPWPDCGTQVSVDFAVSDVPVEEPPHRAARHTMTLSPAALATAPDLAGDGEVHFRLPDGSDQEALSDLLARNEAEALTGLLVRCVEQLGPFASPDRDRLSALSAPARAEIEEEMRRLAPKVEQSIAAVCVGCGRTFLAPFDVQRFLLGELRTDTRSLYEEVHYLAYHYHWSEREIMELTRDKRHTYIDVLAEAIEVLNSGA
jgi:hypothetical protein